MPDLDYIFHPKSIAIVGASSNPNSHTNRFFLNSLIQFNYEGAIYPIHPTASELAGLKAYPSILDVPGPIDFVICGIKADLAPQLMKECVAKGVKVVHFFTSGFSETAEEEGTHLEKEILKIAHQGNVRVLGPNSMGIYCPESRISYESSFPKESGNIGFLSQSGGNSVEGGQIADAKGIRFSKIVSFGNAADLNESDFMEYFADDPQTKIIVAYIEGTKDGKRFANALRKATRIKPVIIIKGGEGKAGTKAVASHTGALAGNNIIWNSLFHQLGVITVYDLEELFDILLLFQHLQPPRGRRLGLIGTGGGRSVLATDSCEREGLVIPLFPQALQSKLRELLPGKANPGTIMCNPVDPGGWDWDPQTYPQILKTVADYDEVDFILTYTRVTFGIERIEGAIGALSVARKHLSKPIVMIVRHSEEPKSVSYAFEVQNRCHQAGIPTYNSFSRAARAIGKFVRYYEGRQ